MIVFHSNLTLIDINMNDFFGGTHEFNRLRLFAAAF